MKRLLTTLLGGILCCGAWALGGADAAPDTIDQAIAGLSNPDPAVRERAVEFLRGAGEAARPALNAAAHGDDPEVAARARTLLKKSPAAAALTPAQAAHDAPEMFRYRASAPAAKREVIRELAADPVRARLLAKLWLQEPDADLRSAIFDEMVKNPSVMGGALLREGDDALAEQLLESAVDQRIAEAPQAYAAYFLCRGRLEQAIRRRSARGVQQPPDPWAQQVLSALYRARGDAPRALAHAQATDDADVLRQVRLWAGDWAQLAQQLRGENPAAGGVSDLQLLAGVESLAGETRELQADLARMTALAQNPGEKLKLARVQLLLGRPREAIATLIDAGDLAGAYELMMTRGSFEDAAGLIQQHDNDAGEEAALLRCAAARRLARLGRRQEAAALIDRTDKQNRDLRLPRVCERLAAAEREAGMTEAAWEHFAMAAETSAQPGEPTYQLIGEAFPGEDSDIDWPALWAAMVFNDAQRAVRRPPRVMFDRLRQVFDRSMPLPALTAAIETVDFSQPQNHPYVQLAWEAARRMIAEGREQAAVDYATQIAERSPGGEELFVHLGDRAAWRKQWQSAAAYYARAAASDPSRPLPLYLQGWALTRAGALEEGREKTELAHLLPLGDETARQELIRGLALHGLEDEASREADVLIRIATPLSRDSDVALRVAAEHAGDRGQFVLSAALWQRSQIDFLGNSYYFRDQTMYLYLAYAASRAQVRATLAGGDDEAFRRDYRAAAQQAPIDIQLPIEVVGDLDKLGKKAEGDELFARAMQLQQGICDRFPESANEHNQLAWLAVMCHREPQKALSHAKQAVALAPKNTAYLDTLAEVCFDQGDMAGAIANMKRCIEIEPDMQRHRKQLDRFETAAEKGAKPPQTQPAP